MNNLLDQFPKYKCKFDEVTVVEYGAGQFDVYYVDKDGKIARIVEVDKVGFFHFFEKVEDAKN